MATIHDDDDGDECNNGGTIEAAIRVLRSSPASLDPSALQVNGLPSQTVHTLHAGVDFPGSADERRSQ